jgi:hypothetical protein
LYAGQAAQFGVSSQISRPRGRRRVFELDQSLYGIANHAGQERLADPLLQGTDDALSVVHPNRRVNRR